MTRTSWQLRLTAGLAVVLAACSPDAADTEPGRTEVAPAAADTAATVTDSTFAPDRQRETLPSNRIYYTLADHEWYARGQPLLHENRAYQPTGMPVVASLPEMRPAGEYHGVEYYTRDADDAPILYIPVFEGYWQAFRADTAATPAP
jgi:hypothetical protein